MRCPRCRGFMVVDHFTDMQLSSGPLWLRAWRCVSCGEILEPGIVRHRLAQGSRMAKLFERLANRPRAKSDVVPLGV